MDFSRIKSAYFIGIGGIGMSGLARILNHRGISVCGSDSTPSGLLDELLDEGMQVEKGSQTGKYFHAGVDMVVYSEAIAQDHSELQLAAARNIPIYSYAQCLGELSKHYKTIAVSGAHGKSTTTAMLGLALVSCGADPTVLVGTKVPQFDDKNARFGNSQWLVVEACEYRRSFLHLKPFAAIILNMDEEHLDYYRDFDDYVDAFSEFSALVPADGFLILNADTKGSSFVIHHVTSKVALFSEREKHADYVLEGNSIMHWGEKLGCLSLQIPGRHNLLNALSVVALTHQMGFPLQKIFRSLRNYKGSWRRFEYKGTFRDTIDVYDDYAHHPTEIKATLHAAREKFPNSRIVCVFQPHQYSRTKKLFDKFMNAFSDADEVIIPNIYRVRDTDQDVNSVNEQQFVESLSKQHPHARSGHGIEKTIKYLQESLHFGDILFTMGAGDVWKVADMLISSTVKR